MTGRLPARRARRPSRAPRRQADSICPWATEPTAAIRASRCSCPRFLGHRRDQLRDPPLSCLRGLRLIDGGYVFALEAKGQTLEGRSGPGSSAQSPGKVRRLSDDSRRAIELDTHHDDVAFGNPTRDTIRGADTDQALPAHHRDPGAPRVAVDRHSDRGPSAGTHGLHGTFRNLDTRRVAGRNDLGLELHVCFSGSPWTDADRAESDPCTGLSVVRPMATVSAWAADAVSPARDKRWPRAAQYG